MINILNPFEFKTMYRNSIKHLNEKKGASYSYGCIMACIDHEIERPALNQDNLFLGEDGDKGIEDEQHVTLLYGTHEEVMYEDVIMFLKNIKMPLIQLTGISLFNNPEFDVVKFDVTCPEFHLYNKLIKLQFPFTSTFPEYVPHMTIAYMQPKTGEEYVQQFEECLVAPVTRWIYSEPNKRKTAVYPDGRVIVLREAQTNNV